MRILLGLGGLGAVAVAMTVLGATSNAQMRPLPPRLMPPILKSGRVDLKQTFTLDIDGDGKDELWFEAKTASDRYFVPKNGVTFSSWDASPHGFAGCRGTNYSGYTRPVGPTLKNAWFCLRTTGGHLAEIQFIGLVPDAKLGSIVHLSYTVWR